MDAPGWQASPTAPIQSCREITSCGCTNGCLTQRSRNIRKDCIEMYACKRRADVCRNIHDDMNDLVDRDLILTYRLINLKTQALTFEPRVIKFGCMLILVVNCNV